MPYPDTAQRNVDEQFRLHEERAGRLAMQFEVEGAKQGESATSRIMEIFHRADIKWRETHMLNPPNAPTNFTNWQEQCAHPDEATRAETARQDALRERLREIHEGEDHA